MGSYIRSADILSNIDDIKVGDVVYIISDIVRLSIVSRKKEGSFDVESFIDSVINKVGVAGTILIPTFNWDFCGGKPFNYKTTPSKVGVLGDIALKRCDFKRTKHPLYSFAVCGKDAAELSKVDTKDAFGADSIFAYMHKNNAKALTVGLPHPMVGMTFVHYVEESVGVPFRYIKNFKSKYIDEYGNEEMKEYSMYVRDLDMDPRHINEFEPIAKISKELNISRSYCFNGVPFYVVYLSSLFELVSIDIKMNDSKNLYIYNH